MNNVYINTNQIASWVADKYFKNKDIVSVDKILCALEDLADDYDVLEEKYNDFKQDVESNYKLMNTEEQIGWSERW